MQTEAARPVHRHPPSGLALGASQAELPQPELTLCEGEPEPLPKRPEPSPQFELMIDWTLQTR